MNNPNPIANHEDEGIVQEFRKKFCEHPAHDTAIPYLKNPDDALAIERFFVKALSDLSARKDAEIARSKRVADHWNERFLKADADLAARDALIVEKDKALLAVRTMVEIGWVDDFEIRDFLNGIFDKCHEALSYSTPTRKLKGDK